MSDPFENSGQLLVLLDAAGRVLHLHSSLERLSGYRQEDTVGSPWERLLAPEEHAAFQETLAQVLAGVPQHQESYVLKAGAGTQLVSWHWSLTEAGEVLGTGLALQEGTLERLRQTEGRYRRLYRQAQRQNLEAQLLGDVRDVIARESEPANILRRAVEALTSIMGYQRVVLSLLEGGFIEPRYTKGYTVPLPRLRLGEGLVGRVAATGESILVPDVREDARYIAADPVVRSELIVPLYAGVTRVGVLAVQSETQPLTEADLRLLTALAHSLSVALERAQLDADVRAREAALQDFLDSASNLIQITAPDGGFRYVNRAWCDSLGYSREEAQGLTMDALLHPDARERYAEAQARAFTGERPHLAGLVLLSKRGHRVYLEGSLSCRFEGDEVLELRGIFQDVSAAERTGVALRREQDFAELLMRNMTQGLIVTDLRGCLLYANESFSRSLGYDPADLRGRFAHELIAESDQQKLADAIAERHQGKASTYELSLKCASGGEMVVLVSGMPRFENGEVVGTIALMTDLTERKQREAERLEHARQLELKNAALERQGTHLLRLAEFRRALVDFIDESLRNGGEKFYAQGLRRAVAVITGAQAGSLLVRDADGCYVYRATVGFDLERLQAVRFSSADLTDAARDHEVRFVHGYPQNPHLDPLRQHLLDDAGRSRDIRITLSAPIVLEGEIVAYLNLDNFSDPEAFSNEAVGMIKAFAAQFGVLLTRLKLETQLRDHSREIERANVALERANRLKSEFLANMSHELRTPLTAIIGFSELLLEQLFGTLNPKQLLYAQDIYNSGSHLLALINDILDLSKIEAGRMELSPEFIEVRSLLEASAEFMRTRAEAAGLRLVLLPLPELPYLFADVRKVRQVLYNLLSNAIKFTPPGGEVRLGLTDYGSELHFFVEDSGIGIAEADQAKLFDEFSQVDASLSRRHEGTGLGLALCKRLVELHGGHIWLSSQVQRGSRFSFSLPRDLDSLPVTLLSRDPVRVQGWRDYLRRLGYRVKEGAVEAAAETGKALFALELFAAQTPAHLEAIAARPQGGGVLLLYSLDEAQAAHLRVADVVKLPLAPGRPLPQALAGLLEAYAAPQERLLVVGEEALRLVTALAGLKAAPPVAHNGQEAVRLAEGLPAGTLLLSPNLPDMSALELLFRLRAHGQTELSVILLLGEQTPQAWAELRETLTARFRGGSVVQPTNGDL